MSTTITEPTVANDPTDPTEPTEPTVVIGPTGSSVGNGLTPTGATADDDRRSPCQGGCAETIAELLAGNGRFCEGRSDHVADRVDLRLQQLHEQHPQVAVLACADSRVDPDTIFDAPLGGVFSVRIAGALATDEALASLQYAVDHLGVRVVVVIGHDGCGAVSAALGDDLPEGLLSLLAPIRQIVDASPGVDPVHATTRGQADKVRQHLARAPRATHDDLVVLSAVYHPSTGQVEIHRPGAEPTTDQSPISLTTTS